ncbi:M23 family metallopeptidase [Luteolibacter ambystomatis]|uniref:M23 family metallopeptidase n=1 Tax=Luteolibacter ambystomatis TaxID=2824561 RepID=A0A975J1R6_9BACT|nr:M23 family metallopeptidase [Luteolibacter ambystomatis]QUE52440.1 M23 family metallopeptidase [Luteolibacter ambystomatis]
MFLRRIVSALFLSSALLNAGGEDIRLPTANDFLYKGQLDKFYMYIDRDFEGQKTKAWEGGGYGFVRNPARINGEVVMCKFHEGIDICPMERDKAGNPLDIVNSISDGTVAYVSPVAGASNYGKYVVVEHNWDNTAVYSIYAHLSEITCKPGDPVKCGGPLGKMGFTGAGIDRTRAHVHLEIVLKISDRYDDWNKAIGGAKNAHGNFNGQNFTGVDAARFFIERRSNPGLTFNAFVASTPVHFKVTVPSKGIIPEFARRYNWMLHGDADKAKSWEISFSATGQPVAFNASERIVSGPTITYLKNASVPHQYLTRGLVKGDNGTGSLSIGGKQLVALISDDFPVAPPEKTDKEKTEKPVVVKPLKPKPKPN